MIMTHPVGKVLYLGKAFGIPGRNEGEWMGVEIYKDPPDFWDRLCEYTQIYVYINIYEYIPGYFT